MRSNQVLPSPFNVTGGGGGIWCTPDEGRTLTRLGGYGIVLDYCFEYVGSVRSRSKPVLLDDGHDPRLHLVLNLRGHV